MNTGIFNDNLLHAPVTRDGSPCGPNLEYAAPYLEFMTLAQRRPEQQLGDSILPAQEPDWRAVLDGGRQLLDQSRDLRIAAMVACAATEVHGLAGLAQTLELISAWLESHWESVHPQLDIDGERDPLFRMNALGALSDPPGLVASLRKATLLESAMGGIRVCDAEAVLLGKTVPESAPVTTADQLTRIVMAERPRNEARIAALTSAHAHLTALESNWRARVEADFWPDLDLLRGLLRKLSDATRHGAQAQHDEAAATEHANAAETASRPAPPPSGQLPDRIDSRRDAFRALEIVRLYFEQHEPSHPAPLLIRRIERLAGLGFAEIVEELTPEGLSQLRHLSGAERAA
jgi:type VI secretion system protein ImpA